MSTSTTLAVRWQHGYIAQWLERLTADQQVPGSNPGVPSFAGVTGAGGELARAGVAPSRLPRCVWMTPLCLRGLMDKMPSSLIFEARLRRESRIRGRCGFKSCRGYFLTMFHGRCAARCGLTFGVRRAGPWGTRAKHYSSSSSSSSNSNSGNRGLTLLTFTIVKGVPIHFVQTVPTHNSQHC